MKPSMPHSRAWIAQTYISFFVSLGGTLAGVYFMPGDAWVKAFLGMGVLFTVASCLSLAKTTRDIHESENFLHKLESAKAEIILQRADEYLEAHGAEIEPARSVKNLRASGTRYSPGIP